MPKTKRAKRRLKMLHYYLITAALIVLGVVVFANTYESSLSAEGFATPTTASPIAPKPLVPEEPLSDPPSRQGEEDEAVPVSGTGRLLPYRSGRLWGYKNTSGQVVIPARFSEALEFDGGAAIAAVNNTGETLYGLINRQGKWLVDPLWQDAERFSEGLAAVSESGVWGFVDEFGTMVIAPEYAMAGSFHDGRARVLKDDRWGYIDPKGALVIEAIFTEAGDFSEGLAFAINEDASVQRPIIDVSGEQAARLKTAKGTRYSSKLAAVDLGKGKYGYVGIEGKLTFNNTFQEARDFIDGLAPVKNNGEWYYINDQGFETIDERYSDAQVFSEGLAAVKPKGGEKYGYIDTSGEMVITPVYDEAQPFEGGYALVRRGIEHGVIDSLGQFKLLYMDTE